MRVKDEDDTWVVLASWDRRGFFESQRYSWAFNGSLNLTPRATAADFDFVQLARDSFVAMAGRREQWPSGIKFSCVHCAISWYPAIENSSKDHLDPQNSVMPSKSLRPALLSRVTKCTPK